MKKFLIAMGVAAFAFVGCDDSSSASAGSNDEPGVESSSAAEHSSSSSSAQKNSSSSEKAKSSSSDTQSDAKQSSSSEKSGKSSSNLIESSSSSVTSESTEKSSSSEKLPETSSSSEKLPETSSSSEKLPETSSSSEKQPESSSSSLGGIEFSSSSVILSSSDVSIPSSNSVVLATPCKNETEDNCEYGELTDNRDGQTYKIVKIGDQWWMAENLNFETENSLCGGGESRSTTGGDCATYGRLYTWVAAMGKSENECGYGHDCDLGTGNVQGVCPVGWHVPTKSEWVDLFATVGGRNTAGRKLKAQTGWLAYSEDISNEDAYGFAALPAGYYDGSYVNDVGECAVFWSVTLTPYGGNIAYYVHLGNDSNKANLRYDEDSAHLDRSDDDGHSVRCLKD